MSYAELVNDCLDHLPGAVRVVITEALVRGAIELCKEANVLVETVQLNAPAEAMSVTLTAPADFVPLRVVEIKEPKWLPGRDYTQRTSTRLDILNPPITSTDITLRLAVQPTLTNTTLPPDLERYREAIYHYALYRLQSTPNKPFTNMELAAFNRSAWLGHLSDAKRHAINGQHNANRIKRMRTFT